MSKSIYPLFYLMLTSMPLAAQEILTNQRIISLDQAKVSHNLIVEKINVADASST